MPTAAQDAFVKEVFGVDPAKYQSASGVGGAPVDGQGAATEPNATGKGTRVSDSPVPLNEDISPARQLPRPMLPDCDMLRGVVPGPDNFVLCKMHGHIVDLDTKQIVAETLKDFEADHPEYRPLPMPMLADCSPERGKVPGPANHLLCRTHGHVVDIATRQVIAWSVKDYILRHPRSQAVHAAAPQTGASTAPPKPDPAGEPDEPTAGDDSRTVETQLRDKANGVSILIGEFESKQDKTREALDVYPNSLQESNILPCLGEALAARELLAKVDAPIHAFREAAGEYVAGGDKKELGEIAKASLDLLDAVNQFSQAMERLDLCLATPPPLEFGSAPDGEDPLDWKEQQLKNSEDADRLRRGMHVQFKRELKPLLDLGVEIADGLDALHHMTELLAGP
jgi:hypothetical protein